MESPGVQKESFNQEAHSGENKEKFFPSGAMAFFVVLVILCLIIWFGIYFLMLNRT